MSTLNNNMPLSDHGDDSDDESDAEEEGSNWNGELRVATKEQLSQAARHLTRTVAFITGLMALSSAAAATTTSPQEADDDCKNENCTSAITAVNPLVRRVLDPIGIAVQHMLHLGSGRMLCISPATASHKKQSYLEGIQGRLARGECSMESVVVFEGVRELPTFFCRDMQALVDVHLSTTVSDRYLPSFASWFDSCSKLRELDLAHCVNLTLRSGVPALATRCPELRHVALPCNLRNLSGLTDCPRLEPPLILPDGIRTLFPKALSCPALADSTEGSHRRRRPRWDEERSSSLLLESITLPQNLQSIGDCALSFLPFLKTVWIPSGVEDHGRPMSIHRRALQQLGFLAKEGSSEGSSSACCCRFVLVEDGEEMDEAEFRTWAEA